MRYIRRQSYIENKVDIKIENLKKFLSSENLEFTVEELYQIMDEELEKPEHEVDTDLIDFCSKAICKHFGLNIEKTSNQPMYKPWEKPIYVQPKQKKARPERNLYLLNVF